MREEEGGVRCDGEGVEVEQRWCAGEESHGGLVVSVRACP